MISHDLWLFIQTFDIFQNWKWDVMDFQFEQFLLKCRIYSKVRKMKEPIFQRKRYNSLCAN